MARATRNAIGGYVYHCLNRANAQIKIFKTDKDYRLFEDILKEGVEKFNMQLLAYCIMPNHWHLVLYPQHDGDLSLFMGWITNTHTKRWHTLHNTIGTGHLYQGRYKSFLVQNDNHFLTLVRYVERNARKANLVQKAEEWRWGSAYLRKYGTEKQRKFLTKWPVSKPQNYIEWLNEPQTSDEEESIQKSIKRNSPFGEDLWVSKIVKKLGIESTIRPRGRPKKGG